MRTHPGDPAFVDIHGRRWWQVGDDLYWCGDMGGPVGDWTKSEAGTHWGPLTAWTEELEQ